MKILMTGGSGFLGGWIANLLGKTHEVVLLGRPSSDFWRVSPNKNIEVVLAEIENWGSIINTHDPDCLILNDWQGVENEYRNDDLQFQNVTRLRNLISSLDCNPRIIGVGSQAELGPCSGQILEVQDDNPTTLYGKAKVEARKTLFESEVSQGNCYWARIFSTYGNMDNGSWLLPSLINSLASGKKFPMTHGEQEWSFLHALDVAFAFKILVENKLPCAIVNIGNPSTVSIKEIASEVGRRMHAPELIQFGEIPYRDDQVMELKPMCESLVSLGWSPRVSLEDGIQNLITEYESNKFDVDSFIQNYL